MLTLLWFGRDLRLADNPALAAALLRGAPILPVFVLDDLDAGAWKPGGAARWWLHGSLRALDESLRQRGNALLLARGTAESAIAALVEQTGADAVYWSRRYEPWAIARSVRLKAMLKQRGVEAQSFNSALLREPWTLATQKGEPYRVFTPFWRALRANNSAEAAIAAPAAIPAPATFPAGERLSDWALRPTAPNWAAMMEGQWMPGEAGAHARLEAFLSGAVSGYRDQRNLPGVTGTSRLSPHLHFGEIGPRQIWHAITARAHAGGAELSAIGAETYLSEIAWREFSYHLLCHFPEMPEAPLRPEFAQFPWAENAKGLAAWQRGMTGYPIVDAGMRELWSTGWMHNRVRMIAASFLIKDLLVDWRRGAAWFWDTLVDADLASNSASWQWVAGSGADAAPYFRIFNPVLQGAKFDPEGEYVRRWIPEISRLSNAMIHAPWTASAADLAAAGIELGQTYPLPIIDHGGARLRALEAFQRIKKS